MLVSTKCAILPLKKQKKENLKQNQDQTKTNYQ